MKQDNQTSHMRDTGVHKAIHSAIAQAKKQTEHRHAFSECLTKQLRSGQKPPQVTADMLSKLGLDVAELTKEAAKEHKVFKSALRKMYAGLKKPRKRKRLPPIYHTVPPAPSLPGPKPKFPFCIFPADDCSYSSPDPTFKHICDPTRAEMGLSLTSTNVGGYFGMEATPWIPPVAGSLWYQIMPPIGGTLAVIAEVLVTGRMDVGVFNPSYLLTWDSSAKADACATLIVRTHQEGIGVQSSAQVLGELHCDVGNFDAHVWVEDLFVKVLYAQVLPAIPVLIEVSIELEGQGRSNFGFATIDLFTQPLPLAGDPGIEVAALCVNLMPTQIL
jgi:hypothetical protein